MGLFRQRPVPSFSGQNKSKNKALSALLLLINGCCRISIFIEIGVLIKANKNSGLAQFSEAWQK
jgi:hypothetical protein